MSNNLTFAELKTQHVELLPARTVLSLFSPGTPGKPGAGTCGWTCTFFTVTGPGGTSTQSSGVGTGGLGGVAGK
jgi:hypothetical protein